MQVRMQALSPIQTSLPISVSRFCGAMLTPSSMIDSPNTLAVPRYWNSWIESQSVGCENAPTETREPKVQ